MRISAYSNRIYKSSFTSDLEQLLIDCNNIKIKLYSDVINGKVNLDDVNTTYIIDNYKLNTYYANMIIREVKAIIKSQQELQKLYISNYKDKITRQETKIKSLQDKLKYWLDLKKLCIKQTKKFENKTVFPFVFKNNKVVTKDKEYNLYEFELLVNKRIRNLRNSLHISKNRLNRLKQKLTNIQTKAPVCCFGSKVFFKKQFTVDKYKNNRKLWKQEFWNKRHKSFTISGCSNFTDGSMCVRYNGTELQIMSHKQGIISSGGKYAKQQWFSIPIEFRYKLDEYIEALSNRETIAYEIIDKGVYFIIKADFEIKSKAPLLADCSQGVNAIDINVDRYALVELDSKGNLLRRRVIKFNLDNLTSAQATKKLEKLAIEIAEFCLSSGKPLVRENIKSIKFKSTENKKINKKLTQFAYNKMLHTIDRALYKQAIEVYTVNPAYTSQQGKIKYMRLMGISVHEAAAFCIGRRYLFSKNKLYYENLKELKKFGSIKQIAKDFKKLRTHYIYNLHKIPIDINNYKKLNKYIEAVNAYCKLNKESIS